MIKQPSLRCVTCIIYGLLGYVVTFLAYYSCLSAKPDVRRLSSNGRRTAKENRASKLRQRPRFIRYCPKPAFSQRPRNRPLDPL